jgi:PAS domain S-box-containing protein
MGLNNSFWSRFPRWVRVKNGGLLIVTFIAVLFCGFVVSNFAIGVLRETEALAEAGVTRLHWSVREAEVELLVLQDAVRKAKTQEEKDSASALLEVRVRFDVFYSRVNSLLVGQQLEEFRKDPAFNANLQDVGAQLESFVPIIDGSDTDLKAALPSLDEDLSKIRPIVRAASFDGLRLFGQTADVRRQALRSVLLRSSYLLLGLFLALLSVIGFLIFLFRLSSASEREARDARARLQKVISTAFDAFLVTDINGRVTEFNEAAERIFGYTREEALGRDVVDLLVPEKLKHNHVLSDMRYLEYVKPPRLESGLIQQVARRKDASEIPIELSLSSATQDEKTIVISYVRDISDRVFAEEELIRARDRAVRGEKAKADLLAVMSHEMRTPLNGIMGTIELLKKSRLTTKQSEYVAAMDTSAGLLLHQVNGVLNMSRAEAGELDLEVTDVNPACLVNELVESQRHVIEGSGNKIFFDTSAAPETIWVDASRLRQIILNLVGNANKFTRNGEIRLECDVISDIQQVEFRVTDTGIGIAEEDLESIFEEFRTLDSSYSRQAEGTGLGLAISRRFVLAMGGEIGVDSEPGEGSIFWFRLPIGTPPKRDQQSKPRASKKQAASLSNPPSAKLDILLVEDNMINRLIARDMLKNLNHNVSEAENGWEGVRFANDQVFDLIFMDISMPELDGVAATTMIRGSVGPNQNTPIIALTAHALPEDAARFQAAGINSTLIKPLSFATLNAALAGFLGRSAKAEAPKEDAQIAVIHAELLEQLGPDQAFAFFDAFRNEANKLVERTLSEGWDIEPLTLRADEVHKLAGSAAALGASELRACLKDLESDYRRGHSEAARQRLPALNSIWSRTRDQVNACLNGDAVSSNQTRSQR